MLTMNLSDLKWAMNCTVVGAGVTERITRKTWHAYSEVESISLCGKARRHAHQQTRPTPPDDRPAAKVFACKACVKAASKVAGASA